MGINLLCQTRMFRTATLLITSLLALVAVQATPLPQGSQTQPDNTKVNQRDKNPGEATADNQKINADDRALTAKIRKAVVADKSLSTYAHNVKIISQHGTVT